MIQGTGWLALTLGVLLLLFGLMATFSGFYATFHTSVQPASMDSPEGIRIHRSPGPNPLIFFVQGGISILAGGVAITAFRKRNQRRGRIYFQVFGGILSLLILVFPVSLEWPVPVTLLVLLFALTGQWIVMAMNHEPVREYYREFDS